MHRLVISSGHMGRVCRRRAFSDRWGDMDAVYSSQIFLLYEGLLIPIICVRWAFIFCSETKSKALWKGLSV